jgi:hypothetical protein
MKIRRAHTLYPLKQGCKTVSRTIFPSSNLPRRSTHVDRNCALCIQPLCPSILSFYPYVSMYIQKFIIRSLHNFNEKIARHRLPSMTICTWREIIQSEGGISFPRQLIHRCLEGFKIAQFDSPSKIKVSLFATSEKSLLYDSLIP